MGAGRVGERPERAEYWRQACSRCLITEQKCLLDAGLEAEINQPRGSLASERSP